MDSTFLCPYCSEKYGVLPSLVGRKVRCHKCENIFSLQFDGSVEKILDRKTKHIEKDPFDHRGERPQAKAIKDQTRRIQKMKGSLKTASELAATHVGNSVALEPKKQIDKNKSAVQAIAPTAQKLTFPYYTAAIILILLCVCVGVLYSVLGSRDLSRQALDAFVSPIPIELKAYPKRMAAYRSRMWVHTRDGLVGPSIIVNIDNAQIGESVSFDWIDVISVTAPLLEKMEKNRALAIWHSVGLRKKIDELWHQYESKSNIYGFYNILKKEDIAVVRFNELPKLLLTGGVDRRLVYVVSVLLASTLEDGAENVTFGLLGDASAPTEVIITEYSGLDGSTLVDAGGHYDTTTIREYCGLIVGLSDFNDGVSNTRLLDVRPTTAMEEFYSRSENPLVKFAERTYDNIRRSELRKRRSARLE